MKVSIIEPKGYCAGVTNAIKLAYKVKNDNPHRNIYILGMLVHNQFVTQELSDAGIVSIQNSEIEEKLTEFKQDDIVIFTAHGHNPKYEKYLTEKGIAFYDATCPKVKQNLHIINNEFKDGHKIIYIGSKGHPETEAALAQNPNVSLYDTKLLNIYQLSTDKEPAVINQTTLNFMELGSIHNSIKEVIPGARFYNEICSATRLRQEAVKNISNDVDLIIVVGDKYSSNTNKLYEIAKTNHLSSLVLMVSDVEQLKRINIKQNKNAVIASGASTPNKIIDEIAAYLKSI